MQHHKQRLNVPGLIVFAMGLFTAAQFFLLAPKGQSILTLIAAR